jgi:hypothetical protein
MEHLPRGSLFKEARAIAAACKDQARRDILRERVNEAQEAADLFHLTACQDDMERLVGAWTRMLLAMGAIGPCGDEPTGQGGKVALPKEGKPIGRDPLLQQAVDALTGTNGSTNQCGTTN